MLLLKQLLMTMRDVLPIIAVMLFFQLVILRRPLKNPRKIAIGLVYVVAGMALFLLGLDIALFELGATMARQLTNSVAQQVGSSPVALDYLWVYLFAAAIGFATTIAEPALIAVGLKAEEQSGGAYGAFSLRLAVAVGVAIGLALGTWRIVTGTPLVAYIMVGYAVVIVQTWFAPRMIVPLAYDSGGVTTSTVTVPLVAALGLELAAAVPGRSPLMDGFGLIAFASLFPIITVLGYAQMREFLLRRKLRSDPLEPAAGPPEQKGDE